MRTRVEAREDEVKDCVDADEESDKGGRLTLYRYSTPCKITALYIHLTMVMMMAIGHYTSLRRPVKISEKSFASNC